MHDNVTAINHSKKVEYSRFLMTPSHLSPYAVIFGRTPYPHCFDILSLFVTHWEGRGHKLWNALKRGLDAIARCSCMGWMGWDGIV